MCPYLIHYPVDDSCILLLVFYKFHSTCRTVGFCYLSPIDFIISFQYAYMVVYHTLKGAVLSTRVKYLCLVPFPFIFTDSTPFCRYSGHCFFPPFPSVKWVHAFIMHLVLLLQSAFLPGSLLNIYIYIF